MTKRDVIRETLKGNFNAYDNYLLRNIYDHLSDNIDLNWIENDGEPALIDAIASVKQTLKEDHYGGFIEEYFGVSITMERENKKYVVSTSVDSSHVYDNIDTYIEEYLFEKVKNISRSVFGPISVKYETYSRWQAEDIFIDLYNALNNLEVNESGIVK